MSNKTIEIVTITCACGKKVDYPNPNRGAINVGHFTTITGWKSLHNNFSYSAIWVCPDCFLKVLDHAKAIEVLLGTPNIGISGIILAGKVSLKSPRMHRISL